MRLRLSMLVLLLFALTVTGQTQDGPAYVPCLDTWAINSGSVFIAKIAEVCGSARCGGENLVALKPERYLKGGPSGELKLQLDAPLDVLKDWKHRKASLLIFDGMDVDPLSSMKAPAQALDLSDPGLTILTARMKVLHDPDQILAAADKAIQAHPGVKHVDVFPEMLLDESVGLTNGFPPLALVPVDADLESWAHSVLLGPPQPALDTALRPEAVRALKFFPTPENTALLRSLLDDPTNVIQPAEFNLGVEVRTYPVRFEAYAVLKEWKVAVAQPVTKEQSEQPEAVRTASLSNRTGMVGQAEIKGLARFENLERLELRNDHLTAQAYKALPRLGSLKALGLGGSNITDNKLADIATLTHLEALDLTGTGISDQGLETLVGLPELKSLNLTRTKVSAGAVKRLQKQRPDIMIQYR